VKCIPFLEPEPYVECWFTQGCTSGTVVQLKP
jgi:hypothetical protein